MSKQIRDAAQALIDAIDARHDQPAPLKYTVPYGAVNALRAALSAPQPTADERRAFEAWASDQGFSVKRLDQGDGSSYSDLRTQGPWDAWQASGRALLSASQDDAEHAAMYRWMRDEWDGLPLAGGRKGFDAAIRAAMKAKS